MSCVIPWATQCELVQFVLHQLLLVCICLITLQVFTYLAVRRGQAGVSLGFAFPSIPIHYPLCGDVPWPLILHLGLCERGEGQGRGSWCLSAFGSCSPSGGAASLFSSMTRPAPTHSLQSLGESFPLFQIFSNSIYGCHWDTCFDRKVLEEILLLSAGLCPFARTSIRMDWGRFI